MNYKYRYNDKFHYIKKFLKKKKATVVILALNDICPHFVNL